MTEEKEDPILKAPENEKVLTPLVNIVETNNDEKENSKINYEQRRISLLNNPNYGVILCFLDQFRAHVDFPNYPLHLLEENLLSDQEIIHRQLIDFHLNLLKRISLGKGAKRDKFPSIISKFAYRFDFDDGEYLRLNGYSQADIDIKLRILKNLLETQLDHNQALKSAIAEKPSFEVRSQPFGRDRSGAFYWLFMDSECFVRLFREETGDDRCWVNLVKDKDELEKFIILLITDHVVRKKFPEWKFAHEPFNNLPISNEFQEKYLPHTIPVKKEETFEESKRIMTSTPPTESMKIERNHEVESKKVLSPVLVKNEVESDHESSSSADKEDQRSRITSSNETNVVGSPQEEKIEINNNEEEKKTKKARGKRKSSHRWGKKRRTTTKKQETDQEIISKPIVKGKKRKQMTDHEEDVEEKEHSEVVEKLPSNTPSQRTEPLMIDEDLIPDDSLPIALRRSRRTRKAPINETPSVTSSPIKSAAPTPTKKKLTNGKCKNSSQTNVKHSAQTSKTKGHRKRGRRRGTGGKGSINGISSSSDEHQPSEDEDEYNSDDYLPDKDQVDDLADEDLLEEEEDDEYVPRRSAKTVAKRRGQLINENVEETNGAASACCICSKTDRPESLLLCDDCDDPYHLECLKPILLAVPDGDWYCPICEHKRFSDKLIEKFIQLIKEHEELEIKRNQCISKRTNRLANVMLNLDRMVKRSTKKRRMDAIVYSDEENDEEEENEMPSDDDEPEQEDDDDNSLYGFKDDDDSYGSRPKTKRSSMTSKRFDRSETQKLDSSEPLGVRSCRRKPQNYRFDDYDKKMKEAMMVDGEAIDDLDKESGESEGEIKTSKRRSGYEKDEDFDESGNKQDDEFAPDPDRSEDSESEEAEEFDEESSDDGWKSKRRTSSRKKPSQPTTRSKRRKTRRISDDEDEDDHSLSDEELSNLGAIDTTKSETFTDMDLNDTGNDDRRRSARATTQKNYAKQQLVDSGDDDDELSNSSNRPPPRRVRYKKRRGSDDSFIGDDDDYEKLAQKREVVKYAKTIGRATITDRIKQLVEDEDTPTDTKGNGTMPRTNEEIPQTMVNGRQNTTDAIQASDDDDFPDEQEIFKPNGLLSLKSNIPVPQPVAFRPAFMPPTHSYQHAIVDPTACFAMIRPTVRPTINNGYPSNGFEDQQ